MTATAAAVSDVVGELYDFLEPEEQDELTAMVAALDPVAAGVPVPGTWPERLRTVYPKHVGDEFAKRHIDFWNHVNAIEPESAPDPFCGFWPRGGGKSTGAELAASDLGCRGKRFYCLYVRETQDLSDKSVENVAALLESDGVAKHYPEHAKRSINKFGQSRGWRRNRIHTAGGFVIDALGLDTASRGVKVEEQRPDLIIFDDIDNKLDGPAATQKKIDIITHTILPAGASNVAVLFIQNLIIPDGVASRLADGRADFMVDRKVSGPHPAVEGLKYEWRIDEASGVRRAVITAGRPTWAGQDLPKCQRMIDLFGLSAFLKECQHRVKDRAEGVALRYDAGRHLIDLTDDQCTALVADGLAGRGISVFGGVDFGAWRFAFTLWAVTRDGIVVRIDEVFAQRLPGEASLSERAQAIHETCERYGIGCTVGATERTRTIPIWGDAANPTDILELNLAFRNGWDREYEEGGQRYVEHVRSRLRVVAVAAEKKSRKTSVERINNLLDKNAIRYRRSVGVGQEWRYNMNAASEGTPMTGSRLLWEMEQWSYVVPRADQEQDQDPEDATADGADMIASKRYAIMSWWTPAVGDTEYPVIPDDQAKHFDTRRREFVEHEHVLDVLQGGTKRTPSVRMPRPRIGGRR